MPWPRQLSNASGIDVPSPAAFHRMAEGWRPFRMWVSILLARHLARAGGWSKPALSAERAAMGRRLEREAHGIGIEVADRAR